MSTGRPTSGAVRGEANALRRRIIALLLFLAGVSLAVPYNFYLARQKLDFSLYGIDLTWHIDLPMRLAHGEIAGRDYIFTYGPLFQVVHAFGLLVPPHDLASLLRFYWFPEVIITLLCVWVILKYTEAPLGWRAAAYLAWVFFWTPINAAPFYYVMDFGIKPLAGLTAVAACARALAAGLEPLKGNITLGRQMPHWGVILPWAFAAPVLTLYSFDLGVITLLALVLTLATLVAGTSLLPGGAAFSIRQRAWWVMAALLAGLVFFAVVLRLAGWGDYLNHSLQVASGYMNKMTLPGEVKYLALIAITLLAGCLILGLALLRLRKALKSADLVAAKRTLALVGATCFSLCWARAGLSRASYGHFLMGVCPLLLIAGCFIPCYLRAENSRLARLAWVAALPLALLTPWGWPDTLLFGSELRAGAIYRIAGVRKIELRSASLEVSPQSVHEMVAAARALPGESLLVWPNEAYLTSLSGKANALYTVQSYIALTEELERVVVARLESRPGLHTLVVTNLGPFDGVENLTRTPIIFRYLLNNFELADSPAESHALLRPVAHGKRTWREEPLPIEPQSFAPGGGRSLTVDLHAEAFGDLRASDLFLLRLRAAKNLTAGVRKPGQLSITFNLSNGEQRTQSILLAPDGEAHELLVSAATFRDPLFVSVFSVQHLWRSSERVVTLRLNWEPMDVLSARPREITIEQVALLRREGVQVLESPLDRELGASLRGTLYSD